VGNEKRDQETRRPRHPRPQPAPGRCSRAGELRLGPARIVRDYRLSVFPIELPPLRDRVEDIPALAQNFLQQSARKLGAKAPRLTPTQAKELQSYDWPGNVRELQNVIERAGILDVLASTRGKIYGPGSAAALLGLKPTTLSSKVHRMELKKLAASHRDPSAR
jgi:transcriptional regulator with GAF, ATPase, and Fis domain